MNDIKLFLKGIIIGIGKIIPGVSGSMLAISLGVYEKILYSLSNIFKDFKNNLIYLFKIGLGILISIIFISKIIIYNIDNNYLPTMFLFIGLILGGIPSLIRLTKKDINKINIILLIIPFLIFFILDLLTKNYKINIELNIFNTFLLGIIDAITMIIPGISGTAIMMMLGVYEDILNIFSNINNIYLLVIYITGILTGIISLSYLINILLKRYKIKCYYVILGFMISSMIILLKETLNNANSLDNIIVSIFLLILGFIIGNKME